MEQQERFDPLGLISPVEFVYTSHDRVKKLLVRRRFLSFRIDVITEQCEVQSGI